jgi:hypothetical protein
MEKQKALCITLKSFGGGKNIYHVQVGEVDPTGGLFGGPCLTNLEPVPEAAELISEGPALSSELLALVEVWKKRLGLPGWNDATIAATREHHHRVRSG